MSRLACLHARPAWLPAPLVILLLTTLVLSACQTLPRQPAAAGNWPERRAALQALDRYDFNGRVAVTGGARGVSAGLQWQQRGRAADVTLRAPLGLGGAEVHFDDRVISYRFNDSEAVQGVRAVEALTSLLGFDPPLASLRYWLIGSDDPALPETHVLDDQSRLASLQQGEWHIDYEGYQARLPSAGLPVSLPQRLTLTRDALRVRIVVQEWVAPEWRTSLPAAGP
jgi:outer membrane lipoprotein LolB